MIVVDEMPFRTIDAEGETIGLSIMNCLKEWEIEKIFTVTVDNASTNDNAIKHLTRRTKDTAFDKLECEDIRYSSYFGGAEEEVAEQANVISKQNEMFGSTRERGRKRQKLIGPPSCEDWKNSRCLVEFLWLFYNATLKFSGTQHVTSNYFFHELVAVQQGILDMTKSSDHMLSGMAFRMLGKFSKYWVQVDNLNPLLHIDVVLDPRYKLRYVEHCMEIIYDAVVAANFSKDLESKFLELYAFYLKENMESLLATDAGSSSASFNPQDLSKVDPAKALRMKFAKSTTSSVTSGGKSEAQRSSPKPIEPENNDHESVEVAAAFGETNSGK
ncbi:unnamed protein product [Linum trigynum]|uniref:hAT-like transposase RNase-H fold domain-containing protein n=1 Tax=Linum trigynum TaxID=586398 RepID=A0AAV2CUE0_9ROSI